MSNAEIANTFSVHRNLVARCIKDYSAIIPEFTNHSNNEIKVILNEVLEINNNLGCHYARGILLTNGIRIHQNRSRDVLKETKGPHDYNVGNRVINGRKYQKRGANAV